MTEILTSDTLATLPGIRHAFFTRTWGNAGFSRNPQGANANREPMAAFLRVAPQNLITCHQIHSIEVVTATQGWSWTDNPHADAIVTHIPGLAIGVLTADCVPVLFADPRAGVVGVAHAGWRGAIGGVIENTLEAMEKIGANRKSTYAALGPSIWQPSYEVGPEFPAPFLAENPENQRFFQLNFKNDRYHFDLPGYVVKKLQDLGVGSVSGSVADTCADPARFFSHRYSTLHNEEREGNLMSAIALGTPGCF